MLQGTAGTRSIAVTFADGTVDTSTNFTFTDDVNYKVEGITPSNSSVLGKTVQMKDLGSFYNFKISLRSHTVTTAVQQVLLWWPYV